MPRPTSYAVFCLKKKSRGSASCRWASSPAASSPRPRCLVEPEALVLPCDRVDAEVVLPFFFFVVPVPAVIYTLSLHDALPIYTSVNAANQVVSVGADIAFDADPKFFACLVRIKSNISKIGRAVQQECRDRPRMPSSA